MDKEKIMKLCQQIGLVAMSNKKYYPALHSDLDFINDAQMDIFREVTAPPKTNGDRIRQMTDEELAEFLDELSGCRLCDGYKRGICNNDCLKGHVAWLRKEVSEDECTEGSH